MQGKVAVLSVLLLSALALQLSFSQSPPPLPSSFSFYCVATNSSTKLSACIAATIPLGMLGVLLALVLVAVVYMAGNILPNSGLRNWYVNELKEAVKSAIILIVIFSVLALMSGFAVTFISGVTPAATGSQYDILSSNLAGMYSTIQSTYLGPQIAIAASTFYGFLGLDDAVALLRSISISVYLPIPPIVLPVPPSGLTIGSIDSGLEENLYSVNTGVFSSTSDPAGSSIITDASTLVVAPTLVLLQVQSDILADVIIVGLGVLIPVGMVLRAFPFLRPLGSMFIAYGIGAALVYPALLLLFNLPVSSYLVPALAPAAAPASTTSALQSQCSSSQSLPAVNGQAVAGPSPFMCNLMGGIADQASADATAVVQQSFPAQQSPINPVVNFGLGFAAGVLAVFTVYPALNMMLSIQFIDVLAQFIMFAFDIIIGIIIVQDVNQALGGPRSLAFGVGRMRLA